MFCCFFKLNLKTVISSVIIAIFRELYTLIVPCSGASTNEYITLFQICSFVTASPSDGREDSYYEDQADDYDDDYNDIQDDFDEGKDHNDISNIR